MPDLVEVALKSALLNRLGALVLAPPLPVAMPNVAFTTPTPGGTVKGWLRATILPEDTLAIGIPFNSYNQYWGIFRVDVFYTLNAGELAPGRVAAQVIQWFKRGTQVTKDGFVVTIYDPPYALAMTESNPWVMLPVIIPYKCFAR